MAYSFRIEFSFAFDTTYPPNGGLADCQGHIYLDSEVVLFLCPTIPTFCYDTDVTLM